jgi:DNA invertase Pin-like site-specific DNA recombinase
MFFTMMESLARSDLNDYFELCRENIIQKKLKTLRGISKLHKMSKVILIKQKRQALKEIKQSCCRLIEE